MPAILRWDGLDVMREELRNLPASLARAHEARVRDVARMTAGSIAAAYPVGPTGNLRRGVRVSTESNGLRSRVFVVSAAPHALLYERGTKPRFYNGMYRGSMPRTPTFFPRTREATRTLEQMAIADLRAAGLQVQSV